MRHMIPVLLVAWMFPSAALAEPARVGPPPPELTEARKLAVQEIEAFRVEMLKLGYKGEADDCTSILKIMMDPTKGGGIGTGTDHPGEEKFAELMQKWSDFGNRLAGIFRDLIPGLEGKYREDTEILVGWFETFEHVARGVQHLNRRRKFCKLTPVTADFSGSLGGYLHGLYLKRNDGHPSTEGLGAHNEDPKLPGATTEGAAAAGGILGGGSAESVMENWLGSEYHRSPVFDANCGRVAFGGLPGGWWSCRNGSGGNGRALGNVVTYPGDGDTDIQTIFANEGPNPLARYNRSSAGTMIIINFIKGKPRKPVFHLLDADGNDVKTLEVSAHNPYSFVAESPLQPNMKYTVEAVGTDGGKFSFSFTTGGGPAWAQGR